MAPDAAPSALPAGGAAAKRASARAPATAQPLHDPTPAGPGVFLRPVARPRRTARAPGRKPLGQLLLEAGHLAPGDLLKALALQARQQTRLGDILLSHGMVSEADLLTGLTRQWDAEVIDPAQAPPDPRLVDALGPAECLARGLLPWRRAGATVVIATARPDQFERQRPMLTARFGHVVMALVSEPDLHAAVLALRHRALAARAETRVPIDQSCRGQQLGRLRLSLAAGAAALVASALVAPRTVFVILVGWVLLTLLLTTGIKLAAAIAVLRGWRTQRRASWEPRRPVIARLPTVSIMVPLHGERDITPRLIRRLGRLTYPRELLDVLLVVEADDTTMSALSGVHLPRWMRVISVPGGGIRTKPRALNYALDFCRGSIVGVYDAEDAPEADQLHRVVRRFHERGPDLACVQGMLDYYNPATNWLSRCFTIEYATWFGIMLPGMERMGLAVPLGGTTLFFRRDVLERLGGWDAHNVTEDADLGIRLARHGYRTELLDTVTGEEANCRVLPWIRQRSRWLKGYAITYAVHMRAPRRLLHELGLWRFFGVQVLFLGTLSQFVLAPVLWSFWLLPFGLWHPLSEVLPWSAFVLLGTMFLTAEAVSIGVALMALWRSRHRFLRGWVPTLHLYFPLAALAVYKALWEILTRPFYWDKTAHGVFDGDARTSPMLPLAPDWPAPVADTAPGVKPAG
jgi:glycosyltransferase XagB